MRSRRNAGSHHCPGQRTMAENLIAFSFNYGQLDGVTAAMIRDAAQRVRGLTRAAVIEVGRVLLQAKERLTHGQFIDWVENECQIRRRSAQRAMQVADMVGKIV